MFGKIAPPFPFPQHWDSVRTMQIVTGDRKWSVPSYSLASVCALVSQTDTQVVSTVLDGDEETAVNENTVIDDDEDLLIMNDVWVERLSKSLKRKQKKAYKVNKKSK